MLWLGSLDSNEDLTVQLTPWLLGAQRYTHVIIQGLAPNLDFFLFLILSVNKNFAYHDDPMKIGCTVDLKKTIQINIRL